MSKELTHKTPAGIALIKKLGGITEYQMKSNGLRVLVLENHIVPTVTVMVTYHVGSRNEVLGNTGATHILEHMLFKGSKHFPKDQGKFLQKMGGRVNATTWFDRTNYYQTLPSSNLEQVIAMEADRMRFAKITDKDLKTEMPVVMNEFERGENDPTEALDKQIWASAFQMHPYHHSTIGWREDIETTNATKLKKFYDTFYHPSNATLTVIGDITPEVLLSYVKKYYGVHKRPSEDIPQLSVVEPNQEGVRRTTVKRPGETNIIGVAFKIPKALSPETHAIHAMFAILGTGEASRLSRRLVDSGLCSKVFIFIAPMHDESIATIYAYKTNKVTHLDIETIILEELELLKKNGVTSEELDRVKARTRSEMAWSRDGSFNIAGALNEAIALGDWTFYVDYLKRMQGVTLASTLAVARKYLTEDQSTVGYFIGTSLINDNDYEKDK